MMLAKAQVDAYNKTVSNETDKKIWSGDFVQEPVPLAQDGSIYEDAILDPTQRLELHVQAYRRADWRLSGMFD